MGKPREAKRGLVGVRHCATIRKGDADRNCCLLDVENRAIVRQVLGLLDKMSRRSSICCEDDWLLSWRFAF